MPRESFLEAQTPDQLHASFVAAFNRGDLDALIALYEPDASLAPQPGQIIHGREANRHALQQFLALKGTMTMTTVFSIQNGDLALLRGEWNLTGTGPDGKPVEMNGKSFEVARRQPNGDCSSSSIIPSERMSPIEPRATAPSVPRQGNRSSGVRHLRRNSL